MRAKYPTLKICLEISGIPEVTDMRVQVTCRYTENRVWLPRSVTDFLPGRVLIPAWLVKKRKDLQSEVVKNQCS